MSDTLKNIELVVKTTVATEYQKSSHRTVLAGNLLVLVENLHPHKSVENQSFHMIFVVIQDATKVKNKCDNKLVDSLTNNHLPHVDSDQRRRFGVRLPVENTVCGRVSSQSKCSEGVHDQIDPEQLHGGQDRSLFCRGHSGNECKEHSSNVDSELEL